MKRGNTVGNNIRRVRLRRGFTQEQLALESGISQRYINQLVSGKKRHTQKTLEQIVYSTSIVNLQIIQRAYSNSLYPLKVLYVTIILRKLKRERKLRSEIEPRKLAGR